MTYKKTWFSYVLWAAYAGICVMLLAFMGFFLCSQNGAAGAKADLGIFLVFPATIVIYRLVRIVSQLIRSKYTMHRHTAGMLEALAVTVSVVFGILYRFSAILRLNMLAGQTLSSLAVSLPIQDILTVPYANYYDMAVVRADGQLTPLTHGAGYLYVLLVSAVCSFLGNKLISAMLLQVLIQLISILIAYLAVRKAAGSVPACVVMLCLSFSDAYISEIGKVSPDSFVFLLYLAGLWLTLSYLKGYCDNRFTGRQLLCASLFTGIVLGILIYLDMKLAILLLYLPALFTGKKKSGEGQSAHHRVINQVTVLIVTLVSCFVILCAAFGIAAADRQLTFEQAASNWLSLYLNKSNISLYYNMAQLQSDLPAVSLIVMAASFLLFEFFRKGKEQNYMLWILACLLIAPTPMMELGILPYAMISFFQWCVLAGLGIQNCIFGDQADAVQAKIEAINAAAEPIAEKLTPAAAKTAQATEALQPQAETLQAEIEAINAAAEPIRYIENPLPLPKKHVKKEMDYQYPVEDKDMKYDVEVDDGDDYDIP